MPRQSIFDPARHTVYRLSRLTQKATLAQVAKKMAVTPGHLNDIEHGRRSMTDEMQNKWNKAIEGLGRRK
jgi:transcriptional regulator with XRE-family HTH domain